MPSLALESSIEHLYFLGISPFLAMIKPLGKNSRNSLVAKGSLTIARQLERTLMDLRSASPLLEDSPLFLGT